MSNVLSLLIAKLPDYDLRWSEPWFQRFNDLTEAVVAEICRECSKCAMPINDKNYWVLRGSGGRVCEDCYEFLKPGKPERDFQITKQEAPDGE